MTPAEEALRASRLSSNVRPTFGRGINLEKIYEQTAALPFRRSESGIEFLLISSIRTESWIVPKGILDKGISYPETACEEAFEEAGVLGKIWGNEIGEYRYKKGAALCRVKVYPLDVSKVLEKWPEKFLRKRRWASAKEAAGLVRDKDLGEIILKLSKFLMKEKFKEFSV